MENKIICVHPEEITTQNVKNWLGSPEKNKKNLIKYIIECRFKNRYMLPIENLPSEHKNTFLIMAISCLIIEALYSFYEGQEDTRGSSKQGFQKFFEKNNCVFPDITGGLIEEFYKNIRCGILHQAETTGGWQLTKEGQLFDTKNKQINVISFYEQLKECLKEYEFELNNKKITDIEWINALKKIHSTIKNYEFEN